MSLWKRRDTRLIAERVSGSRFERTWVRTSVKCQLAQPLHHWEPYHLETALQIFCSSYRSQMERVERQLQSMVSVKLCVIVHALQSDVLATLLGTSCFCYLAIRRWLSVCVESHSKRSRLHRRRPDLDSAVCRQSHWEDDQSPGLGCLGCHAERYWEEIGADLLKSRFGGLQKAQIA